MSTHLRAKYDHAVLVAGAAAGFRKVIALALADAGYRVIAADKNLTRLDEVSRACATRGPGGIALRLDVCEAVVVAGMDQLARSPPIRRSGSTSLQALPQRK